MSNRPQRYFTQSEEKKIIEAIGQTELATSGEMKVHVEGSSEQVAFERGVALFSELEMENTAQRNGVLFYIAMETHQFAIIADEGINKVVPSGFWNEITDSMREEFKQGNIVEGIVKGVEQAGLALKEHFPYQSDDRNEISNEISTD